MLKKVFPRSMLSTDSYFFLSDVYFDLTFDRKLSFRNIDDWNIRPLQDYFSITGISLRS